MLNIGVNNQYFLVNNIVIPISPHLWSIVPLGAFGLLTQNLIKMIVNVASGLSQLFNFPKLLVIELLLFSML